MEFVRDVIALIPALLRVTPVVLQLAVGAMALALVLGLVIALVRVTGPGPLRALAAGFVELVRGTPLLVQLVYIYFVLPELGVEIDPVPAGILGLGLNYAAYLSEVFRSAILSIDRGQHEAALSLGYTPTRTLLQVVLPQSFTTAIGPVGNYFVAMVKDTSLTSVIAVTEILKQSNVIASQTFQTTEVYTAAALLYLAISLPLARLVALTERRIRARA